MYSMNSMNFILSKGLPKCKNCMYYVPYGVSKTYDLAKCNRFLDKHNKPIYAEMARMDDLKCSMYGTQFKPMNNEKIE
jgi:hypothetical protein